MPQGSPAASSAAATASRAELEHHSALPSTRTRSALMPPGPVSSKWPCSSRAGAGVQLRRTVGWPRDESGEKGEWGGRKLGGARVRRRALHGARTPCSPPRASCRRSAAAAAQPAASPPRAVCSRWRATRRRRPRAAHRVQKLCPGTPGRRQAPRLPPPTAVATFSHRTEPSGHPRRRAAHACERGQTRARRWTRTRARVAQREKSRARSSRARQRPGLWERAVVSDESLLLIHCLQFGFTRE